VAVYFGCEQGKLSSGLIFLGFWNLYLRNKYVISVFNQCFATLFYDHGVDVHDELIADVDEEIALLALQDV